MTTYVAAQTRASRDATNPPAPLPVLEYPDGESPHALLAMALSVCGMAEYGFESPPDFAALPDPYPSAQPLEDLYTSAAGWARSEPIEAETVTDRHARIREFAVARAGIHGIGELDLGPASLSPGAEFGMESEIAAEPWDIATAW